MVENWFKVLISAFIPIVGAFFLPRAAVPYCVAAALMLIVLAIISLIRHERRQASTTRKEE